MNLRALVAPPRVEDRLFPALCARYGVPVPVQEYRFAPPRRWRLDWAWPAARLALEVEGGVFPSQQRDGGRRRGRHVSISGFLGDVEKYNELACRGWRLLRRLPADLCTVDTVRLVQRALEAAA